MTVLHMSAGVRVAACIALTTAIVAGCALSPPASPTMPPVTANLTTLRFGVQASKPDEVRTAWSPLITDFGRKNNIATTLVVGSQSEIVAALAQGTVDVVWLSSNVAIDAVVEAGAEAFALYVNVNGTQGYKGVLVAKTGGSVSTLDDALTPQKYRYASGAKTSTSGYVLPQHFLFNPRTTSPEALFKSVIYRSHFDNLDALWTDKVDIAVNNSTDLAVFQARTPGAAAGLRVLWESPLVPNDVLMMRATDTSANKSAITAMVFAYGKSSTDEQVLLKKASGIARFVPTDNQLLAPVSEFKFATERATITANTGLSTAERAQRHAMVDQRRATFAAAIAKKSAR